MDKPRRRRKPKDALALWIVESRERMPSPDQRGWTSAKLAERLGVSDSTVRGWEAGRSVSPGNIAAMEHLFGTTAPGREEDQTTLAAAVIRQARATEQLVARLDLMLFGIPQRYERPPDAEAAFAEVYRIMREGWWPPSGVSGLEEGVRRAEEHPDDEGPDMPTPSPERQPLGGGAERG